MSNQEKQLEILRQRIASLPPEKQAFFMQQLKQKGLSISGLKSEFLTPDLTNENLHNSSSKDKVNTNSDSQAEKANTSTSKRSIYKRDDLDDYPLSYAQERLWFLYQLDPENPAYNIGIQWQIYGDLDLEILQQSFTEIIQRHEVLRTAFSEENGQPKLTVQPASFSMPVIDVGSRSVSKRRSLSPSAQADERDTCFAQASQRLAQAEINRPFDLTQPPLLRVTVIQASAPLRQKAEGRRQKAEGRRGFRPKSKIQNPKSR